MYLESIQLDDSIHFVDSIQFDDSIQLDESIKFDDSVDVGKKWNNVQRARRTHSMQLHRALPRKLN